MCHLLWPGSERRAKQALGDPARVSEPHPVTLKEAGAAFRAGRSRLSRMLNVLPSAGALYGHPVRLSPTSLPVPTDAFRVLGLHGMPEKRLQDVGGHGADLGRRLIKIDHESVGGEHREVEGER